MRTSPRRLPTFEGYTVDIRLREFRRLDYGKEPEFIDFDTEQGDQLLAEYLEHLWRKNRSEWQRVIRVIF